MINKQSDKLSILLSDHSLDRREDIYPMFDYGKTVNKYTFGNEVYSIEFWKYLKENFNVKKENITTFCDISTDVKNRVEKVYKYIIKIEEPYKIFLQFYDEEKVVDDKIYETEEDQKNKITNLMIHYDYDVADSVDKMMEDLRQFVYLPSMDKTFYTISSGAMGYELRPANIKDFDIDIKLNYGDDFVNKYDNIVGKLKNNKHGLFIFHGEAGTGKCVDGSTIVTLRNKKTGDIEEISVEEFEKLLW